MAAALTGQAIQLSDPGQVVTKQVPGGIAMADGT